MANQVHAEENNFFTSNYTCTTNNLTLHLALIVVPFELEISSNDEENSIENDGLTVSFRFTIHRASTNRIDKNLNDLTRSLFHLLFS